MCMMPVEVCAERKEWHEVVRRVTRQLLPDVNARFGEKLWTLLSYASKHDQIKIVDLLVRYKNINLNATNADGMTAMHEAAKHNHLQVLSILLRAGADPNLHNRQGETPLDLATSDGCQIFELEEVHAEKLRGPLQPCPHCTFENPHDTLQCKMCQMDLAKSEDAVAVLMQRIQLLEEAQLCSICEELPKDTVFTCGHETCMSCAEKLTNCPNCREPITARIRRFV
ncbi:hypothetical protein THRCLA_10548 [Thraustotheca clavata]|uniref:RING-type domain-containing protein n=1 Tax=Thraustotheca clavata TaxID=74557 RepID=A0A1V9YL91_9STRA|nr:hypothetical protein THRCLA_10548 [Thraustotheca clavata]